jgi:hypothetical protein
MSPAGFGHVPMAAVQGNCRGWTRLDDCMQARHINLLVDACTSPDAVVHCKMAQVVYEKYMHSSCMCSCKCMQAEIYACSFMVALGMGCSNPAERVQDPRTWPLYAGT